MMFSIIIPVHNAGQYLRSCLDSVLFQTEQDWECVCVDDGSTDNSGAILDEYAAKDRRFHVVHTKNEGVAIARNAGLRESSGEWVSWLDADDEYASWRLEEAVRIIKMENPDLIRFKTKMVHDSQVDASLLRRSMEYEVFTGEEAKIWCWDILMPASMLWTFVAKRDFFNGNRFVPGMRVKEEFPVCARIATRVCRVVQSKAEAYVYRQVEGSAMHKKKSAEESVRFFETVGRCMKECCFQRNVMSRQVYQTMRRRIRNHCDCEVLDWYKNHYDAINKINDIRRAYLELKADGIFDECGFRRWRYGIPLWLWERTGQTWMMNLVFSLEVIVSTLRAYFGDKVEVSK